MQNIQKVGFNQSINFDSLKVLCINEHTFVTGENCFFPKKNIITDFLFFNKSRNKNICT